MAAITVAMRTEISQLYVSLFGRAPDSEGLGFWVSSYAGGNTIAKIAQSMYETSPARAYYPLYATPSEVVTTFYSNVLGRAPDAEGLAFWVKEFNAAGTPGTFFAKLVSNVVNYNGTDAAGLTSQSLFNNKVAVAQFYGENAGTVAGATSALSGVTSVASTVDTAKAAILSPTPAVVASQTFTLTTSVDAVSGGAGDDTIAAIMATASTYNVGDSINGGAGTDTLNIIDVSGTAASVVSLDGVEIVNVRSLVATGTDVTELDASDWDGVTKLTNASSIAGSELQVSGLSISTNVNLVGNTDISIDFSNTTTANAAATLVGAGTFAGVTTYGVTGVTSDATAHLNLDAVGAGRVSAIAVELSGNNLANIEAGANVEVYTITGNGSAVLFTDDTLTSVNATGYAGSLDITLAGVSEAVVKGGGGNDTLRLGTTISNSDSFDGGLGTDKIVFTVGGFNRNLNTTNVESADITFKDDAGGTVGASGSTLTTYNLYANSAGADGGLSQIADASTVNLKASADAFGLVEIDTISGAQTLTIAAGTASGAMAFDLTVTDVANITLSNVAGTANNAGTLTIATASFDSDARSIAINAVASTGAIAFTDILIGGATSLTITSEASAGVTFATGISGSALSTVSLIQNGSADIVGETLKGTGLTSITLDANGGGNVYLADPAGGSGLLLGNGGLGGTVSTITVNMMAETNSDVGTAASGASGIIVNTTGAVNLNLNIVASSASGGVHLGAVTVAAGSASAETTNTIVNFSAGSIATNSIIRSEVINIDAMTGTQVNVGAVTVGASATFVLASGGIDATDIDNVDVSALSLTLAASAIVQVGAITTTGGALGSISLVEADGASATFGAVIASGMGAVSITVASGASATFGNITTTQNLGAIELNGSDVGGVTFGTIGASAVGSIYISGALDVTLGAITTNRIGAIDATNQGVSGALTIDLSGVSAAAEVRAGVATNIIISGQGNDVITLVGGRTSTAGNDTIRFTTSIAGTDYVTNFIAGALASGGDQIEIDVAAYAGNFKVGTGSALAAASVISFSTGEGSGFTFDDTMILLKTAYASTAAMITDLTSDTTLGSAIAAASGSADYMVVWTDGVDTYVSQVSVEAEASAGETTLTLASASAVSVVTLVQIAGVTPGALSANVNLDVV